MRRSKALTVFCFAVIFIVGLMVGRFLTAVEFKERLDQLESQVISLQALIEEKDSRISQLEQQLDVEVLGVYFSPKGGCEDQVIYWISKANISIHVMIYAFTLDSIGDALIDASRRGVEVKVVFEKSQINRYSEYHRLRAAGIEVRNDTNAKLMHNKVLIVDGVIVVTGSFNWSKNAENYNNENIIIIRSTYVAAEYEEEFQKIWNESV